MKINTTLLMILLLSMIILLVGCGADNGGGPVPTTDTKTTSSIVPTVSFTSPADGEVGVLINRKIVATFSEAMDPLTITDTSFTVMQGTTLVIGTITYSAVDRTATFTPTTDILPSTIYTATITNEATTAILTIEPTDLGGNTQTVTMAMSADKAGTTLAADKVWSFTTGDL